MCVALIRSVGQEADSRLDIGTWFSRHVLTNSYYGSVEYYMAMHVDRLLADAGKGVDGVNEGEFRRAEDDFKLGFFSCH